MTAEEYEMKYVRKLTPKKTANKAVVPPKRNVPRPNPSRNYDMTKYRYTGSGSRQNNSTAK